VIHLSQTTWPRETRCGAKNSLRTGDAITSEFSTVTCPACIALGDYPPPPMRDVPLVEQLAHFGDSHYGELEWMALGLFTVGLGVLPMIATKKVCQFIMRKRDA